MTKPKRTTPGQPPNSNNRHISIAGYMLILFIAAFLLLLLAFFQQQRASKNTIEGLQKTSVSAMASVQDIMQERDELQEKLAAAEEKLDQLQSTAKEETDALTLINTQLYAREAALDRLNLVRALYNQGRYEEAREAIEAGESADTEIWLEQVSLSLSPAEREIYDPLESYQLLKSWLQ